MIDDDGAGVVKKGLLEKGVPRKKDCCKDKNGCCVVFCWFAPC